MLANAGANFVQALMELELENAGDNEERKAAIRKKYANMQFVATVAQIVVDTAGAIMKGFQQLGPIGGAIAAALIGATGIAQVAIANAQRKKMLNGYSSGGYTGDGGVYEPAGVVHRGEYVVPQTVMSHPDAMAAIRSLESIRQRKIGLNPALASIPYASGGAVNPPAATNNLPFSGGVPEGGGGDPELKELFRMNLAIYQELLQWKPTVYTETIKKQLNTLDDIEQNRGL